MRLKLPVRQPACHRENAMHALSCGMRPWLPYVLVVASASFVYVALADLIPQLQRRLGARDTVSQVLWLALGIVLVTAVSQLAH